jgi:hypothetical protein
MRHETITVFCLIAVLAAGCADAGEGQGGKIKTAREKYPVNVWVDLFDGMTLTGWKTPEFGGSGKVWVKDKAVHIGEGVMCTGITWNGRVLRDNYEVEVEAMRVKGLDFFCGLTFPVGEDHMTLVCSGWGGSVTGLSCINGMDASENETGQYFEFKNNRWYKILVSVTPADIKAYIDEKEIISLEREGRIITIRPEVELSLPLGITTWQTHGAVRAVRIIRLPDPE